MSRNRPFTMIAAVLFALIAIAHLYRIATHFQVILGSHPVPLWMSWIGVLVPGVLAVMLYRESRR